MSILTGSSMLRVAAVLTTVALLFVLQVSLTPIWKTLVASLVTQI